MEGMISKEIIPIQADYVEMGGCTLSVDTWAKGLVEVTHGQWLYPNIHVHDAMSGMAAKVR